MIFPRSCVISRSPWPFQFPQILVHSFDLTCSLPMNRAFPEIYRRLFNSLEASGDADLALQQITDGQRALEKTASYGRHVHFSSSNALQPTMFCTPIQPMVDTGKILFSPKFDCSCSPIPPYHMGVCRVPKIWERRGPTPLQWGLADPLKTRPAAMRDLVVLYR